MRRRLVKLLLNLIILAGLGWLSWFGYRLFVDSSIEALQGSILLITGFAVWVAIIKLSRSQKYKLRWAKPSLSLTTFLVTAALLVFAFAGVQPLSDYKDKAVVFVGEIYTNIAESLQGTNMGGESELRNPSWAELKSFLLSDDTDEMEYIYPTTVCADFANKLKRNAEEAGLRCAIVTIQLTGYSDPYGYGIPSNTPHALNAFETTDRGLVFIDCTGVPSSSGFTGNADKIVEIVVGKAEIVKSIFPQSGWSDVWGNGGIVVGIDIEW